MCWTKATLNVRLESALADCDAALRLAPANAPTLDTRGFAHLRLGQYDAAIADYDAALKLRPEQAASLYGRGVAKIRKGLPDAAADLAAARKANARVEAEFKAYGVEAVPAPTVSTGQLRAPTPGAM